MTTVPYQRRVQDARTTYRERQADVQEYLDRGGKRSDEAYGKLVDRRNEAGAALERILNEGPKGPGQ